MKNQNRWLKLSIIIFFSCLICGFIAISCIYFDPLNPYGQIDYWAKSYGAINDEQMNAVIPMPDGGSIFGGYTNSFGIGGQDGWLMKLDSKGNIEWEKAYGTLLNDRISSICHTSDNNLIIAGNVAHLFTEDEINNDSDNNSDMWVMKCDLSGNILWDKRFGGNNDDEAMAVDETADGGYIVAGKSNSFGDDDPENWVTFIVKFTPEGDISWIREFGKPEQEDICILEATDDGGMVIGGNTCQFGSGNSDFRLIKLSKDGKIIWEKAYGKSSDDRLCSLMQTSDNGFILTGLQSSAEISAIDNKRVYQIIKINSEGTILWQKSLFDEFSNEPWTVYTSSIDETAEGRYVVAMTAEVIDTKGLDFHLLKFDQGGSLLWQKSYGGDANDHLLCIKEVSDSGYIVTGKTYSFDVEKADAWIVKLLPNGECPPLDYTPSVNLQSIPFEVTDTATIITEISIPSITISSKIAVTKTSCTIRQQAPQ
ncbi:MAG: hypothetical protein JXJ04_17810 [Spirochaetales bacterium]|nr:hypothetical protein [Spirochaetales bacterium]